MIKTLLTVLFAFVIAGLIGWVGVLLLGMIHAPAILATIWVVIVVIVVLCFLYNFFVSGSKPLL